MEQGSLVVYLPVWFRSHELRYLVNYRLFVAMSKTTETRERFIKSAIDFARDSNFDGIDIDWEYPVDKQQYAIFVKVFL